MRRAGAASEPQQRRQRIRAAGCEKGVHTGGVLRGVGCRRIAAAGITQRRG
jgi:hypothetical protein